MEQLEKLYQESIKLIDENPKLTTDKIPSHLLEVWLYNGEINQFPSAELLIAVAIYNYANEKYGDPRLPAEKDNFRFELMQYILAAEYACRKVSGKLRPRQIFNFETHNIPLDIDLKRNQVNKFKRLAATLVPLRNRGFM